MNQNSLRRKPRKNKKYRFQLLHQWLIIKYHPIRVLDVAGGKGLLTYLLNESGWEATVVDPATEFRPLKYRELETKKQIRISKEGQEKIPRIKSNFQEDMVKDYDLIVGIHAHGCNIQIIDACTKYNKDLLLMPCCVVDEPIEQKPNIDWLEALILYAQTKGFDIKKDILDFKGQNVLIYTDRYLKKL